MHQPQPLHWSLSIMMLPVSNDWERALRGHAATQAGSWHFLQVKARLFMLLLRTTRMRDLTALKTFSWAKLQEYSQIWQPTHLSESAEMNFRL
jgi:hypothetical protein